MNGLKRTLLRMYDMIESRSMVVYICVFYLLLSHYYDVSRVFVPILNDSLLWGFEFYCIALCIPFQLYI